MKIWSTKLSTLLLALIILACSKVPITNRRQTKLLPESQLIAMAQEQYQMFLQEHPPIPDANAQAQRVDRVGQKIAASVENFLASRNQSTRVEGFAWRFETINEDVLNAWCMPGGYVAVYTPILELAETDDELAVVMGHEIAHAIARHGNERMSNAQLVNVGGAILGAGGEEESNAFLQAYGIVTGLGMLKYSRKHESEADKLGLVFMTLAGYKPEAAITFWEKMQAMGGEKPPVLLSTHPSDDQRIQDIKEFIPEIPKYTSGKGK